MLCSCGLMEEWSLATSVSGEKDNPIIGQEVVQKLQQLLEGVLPCPVSFGGWKCATFFFPLFVNFLLVLKASIIFKSNEKNQTMIWYLIIPG